MKPHNLTKIRILLLIVSFLGLLLVFWVKLNFPNYSEKSSVIMGTTVRIKINERNSFGLIDEAFREMKRLERLFSKFDPSSEVSRLNRGEKFKLSPDTQKIFQLAEKVKKLSGGAFDITLGRGKEIDLGGIGKGYAVEAARGLLLKRGIRSAIIDGHSSIAVIGDGWKVGVKDPGGERRETRVIILNDGEALSTSGQYEQPGHITDPRTGKAADKCLSVTVIAKDAALADTLSTAVFILGPEKGLKLAKSLGVQVLINI